MEALNIDGWVIQDGVNGDACGRRTLASKILGKSRVVITYEEGKYIALKVTIDFNGDTDEYTVGFAHFAEALHSCDEWLNRKQVLEG